MPAVFAVICKEFTESTRTGCIEWTGIGGFPELAPPKLAVSPRKKQEKNRDTALRFGPEPGHGCHYAVA
jgi:hypothetical protein